MKQYSVSGERQDAGLRGIKAGLHFGECEVKVGHGCGVVQLEERKHELLAVCFGAP
jgi:hypothetical protein